MNTVSNSFYPFNFSSDAVPNPVFSGALTGEFALPSGTGPGKAKPPG